MTSHPPLIMTSEEGSFARNTIQERKPLIVDSLLLNYDFTPSIRNELLALKSELKHGLIQPLREESSDREIWDKDLEPWLSKTWLEIPWFLAETYFYRRVLEIVRYFQPGPWNMQDPYELLKDKELFEALPVFTEIDPPEPGKATLESFRGFCYRAMWGNRGDLSNLNVFDDNMGEQTENIILNQSADAFGFLKEKPRTIAYFMDNTGKELFFDLAFIDYLLSSDLADHVTCYLKNQPFFVSDAMPEDFTKVIDLLSTSDSQNNQRLSQRLSFARKSGRISIQTPPFLTTSSMFCDMPEVSTAQIGAHDLAILKGDVNYRRLVGDRHWDPTTPIEEAAGYFPTNFLSLRTLKAELILGLTQATYHQILQNAEPDWLINGKRGMITFLAKYISE